MQIEAEMKFQADKPEGQSELSATPCSASCLNGGHVFAFAGQPPEGRIPEGWPCGCGQTVAHWQKCSECGSEHLKAVTPNKPS